MKTQILQILKSADAYVSGQELCERMGVSRTAVWKNINKLKEEGYIIEAVQNKGYRMVECPDVVTESEIKSQKSSGFAGNKIFCYDTTDSTNNQARRLGEAGEPHGTLVTAETQSAGKGRRGRSWASPSGSGIWMSILLRPDLSPAHAPMLTLVAGLSMARAIEKATGLSPRIKWPNDLVLNGRKICGILTEMSTEVEQIHYVVIGIGVNANIDEFPPEIKDNATSLKLELGKAVVRAEIIAAFLEFFEKDYETFLKDRNFRHLKKVYNGMLINVGKPVKIMDPGNEYTGTALGIDEEGRLLVEKEGGGVLAVSSGEVSVRGVYGYV